jgi:hypothetical protein
MPTNVSLTVVTLETLILNSSAKKYEFYLKIFFFYSERNYENIILPGTLSGHSAQNLKYSKEMLEYGTKQNFYI